MLEEPTECNFVVDERESRAVSETRNDELDKVPPPLCERSQISVSTWMSELLPIRPKSDSNAVEKNLVPPDFYKY